MKIISIPSWKVSSIANLPIKCLLHKAQCFKIPLGTKQTVYPWFYKSDDYSTKHWIIFATPMIGAPAFAILTAHSPGVLPSPSPCGPGNHLISIFILVMNLWLPLMLCLFHMYICICITNTVCIKNHRYSTYHNASWIKHHWHSRISPMHIVAATGLL